MFFTRSSKSDNYFTTKSFSDYYSSFNSAVQDIARTALDFVETISPPEEEAPPYPYPSDEPISAQDLHYYLYVTPPENLSRFPTQQSPGHHQPDEEIPSGQSSSSNYIGNGNGLCPPNLMWEEGSISSSDSTPMATPKSTAFPASLWSSPPPLTLSPSFTPPEIASPDSTLPSIFRHESQVVAPFDSAKVIRKLAHSGPITKSVWDRNTPSHTRPPCTLDIPLSVSDERHHHAAHQNIFNETSSFTPSKSNLLGLRISLDDSGDLYDRRRPSGPVTMSNLGGVFVIGDDDAEDDLYEDIDLDVAATHCLSPIM